MSTNLSYKYVETLKTPGRYTDALVKGLHIWVKPNLSKYWIFRYSINKKQQNISLGPYPRLSIADARIKAQAARDKINYGSNPLVERKEQKVLSKTALDNKPLFKDYALQCVEAKRAEWRNQKHAAQWLYTLEQFAFPIIGDTPIDKIEMEDILQILTPIWTSKTETASRLRGRLEWIFAAATTKKYRTGINPALWRGFLQTILPAPKKVAKVKHHKALPYKEIPSLILELQNSDNVAYLALEFAILNASRTGEVIGGLKSELKNNIWIIPDSRMKASKEHRVPLCQRSLDLIATANAIDPGSSYLFSRNGRPLSSMAMAMTLRRLKIDATVHGFRSSFRDWVSEETEHPSEVAEMALAHTIGSKVEAAYRRKDLLEKRRRLLLDWESYCLSAVVNNIIKLKVA